MVPHRYMMVRDKKKKKRRKGGKEEKKRKKQGFYVANAVTQLVFISWRKTNNYVAKKPWKNYVAKKGCHMRIQGTCHFDPFCIHFQMARTSHLRFNGTKMPVDWGLQPYIICPI